MPPTIKIDMNAEFLNGIFGVSNKRIKEITEAMDRSKIDRSTIAGLVNLAYNVSENDQEFAWLLTMLKV